MAGGPGRLLRLAAGIVRIAVFDIAGPLVAYSMLRAAGHSTVTALVLSGAFPALGVIVSIIANRRADAIGILVLAGMALGAVLGLLTQSARLVLLEGSVPTGAFGLICLGSLLAARPLMFRFALEFMGPGSQKGRDFERLWQYPEFRRAFRNLTAVWGAAYVLEAVARIFIVERTSAGSALAVSKVMPLAVFVLLAAWTVVYSLYQQRRGRRLAAAARRLRIRTNPKPPGIFWRHIRNRIRTSAGNDERLAYVITRPGNRRLASRRIGMDFCRRRMRRFSCRQDAKMWQLPGSKTNVNDPPRAYRLRRLLHPPPDHDLVGRGIRRPPQHRHHRGDEGSRARGPGGRGRGARP